MDWFCILARLRRAEDELRSCDGIARLGLDPPHRNKRTPRRGDLGEALPLKSHLRLRNVEELENPLNYS
jgi:hypothetical protein